jgi:HEAT repeat protein
MEQLRWQLAQGDLTNDGLSDEAAMAVLTSPELLPALMSRLGDPQPVVRGHAADCLEKVARQRPAWLAEFLPDLIVRARGDDVPMVRWHLAMVFGHLATQPAPREEVRVCLLDMLSDPSPFVRSWAIVSLLIHARLDPEPPDEIARSVAALTADSSAAVRSRAVKAIGLLTQPGASIPQGWIKSEVVRRQLLAGQAG